MALEEDSSIKVSSDKQINELMLSYFEKHTC